MSTISIEQLKILNLYCEKAQELLNSKFVNFLNTQKSGLKISYVINKPLEVITYLPDEESIKSFILTYRFFCQDNEKISIRNIDVLIGNLNIDNKLGRLYSDGRNKLNAYFNSNSIMTHNKKLLTKREVFEIFLYGSYAHCDERKKVIFDNWKSNPSVEALMKNEWILILHTSLKFIAYSKNLIEKMITENELTYNMNEQ